MITQAEVQDWFTYVDGNLVWKKGNAKVLGKIAGCFKSRGYRYVCLNGKHYRVHRLIFLYHHGYLPELVDHDDNDRRNNHIENLIDRSNSENLLKSPFRQFKASGVKGLIYSEKKQKWILDSDYRRGNKRLGEFDAYDDAVLCAKSFYADGFQYMCSREVFLKFSDF